MALAKAVNRAILLAHAYKENGGILLIAGSTQKSAYDDNATLSGLTGSLNKEGLSHSVFDQILIDFHSQNRRSRKVKVVVSEELLLTARNEIVMSNALKHFQTRCGTHQDELTAWMIRKNDLLLTVAAGFENQQLHAILDTSGNPLVTVPVLNFSQSGTFRKEPPKAFVYGIKKPT